MTEILDSVTQRASIKAMDEILQLGEVNENTLTRMASHAGLSPDEMSEKIEAAHLAFYGAASDYMAERGVVDEDAFAAFIAQNPQHMQGLTEAARSLVMNNDPTGFDGLADAFLEQADVFMTEEAKDALDAAGLGWAEVPGGGHKVIYEGVPVSRNVAVRQRLITFS